jgi:hypothetical protein
MIRTADPAATVASIVETSNQAKGDKPPMIRWDVVRGATGLNAPGEEALRSALAKVEMDQSSTTNPTDWLNIAKGLKGDSIVFLHNIHRQIEDPGPVQALWNLRDEFKKNRRTIIGLVPGITLPPELAQDVLIIDEPLPTDTELGQIAKNIYAAASLPEPDDQTTEKIIDATLGLAAFPAEQSMAMSLTKDGMDIEELWSKKRSVVEQTPGLSVWRGGETFKDIGGCDNVKGFLKDVIAGNKSPRSIVFIDEIEKAIGTGQDTSGVSQGMLGTLLTWMQDNSATGCIFIGPPGAAKSAIAKATGNEAGIPTISLDMGAMKASLVGESEQRFRNALKVVEAVSQKRSLFIATCNSIGILPPELRRRFTFGTFFFGLPTQEERNAIWSIYRSKYGISSEDSGVENDHGWTGAEIRQCCDLSYRLKRTLDECSRYIVPVSVSAADSIKRLEEQADGKFISASYPGLYRKDKPTEEAPVSKARAISF